MCIDTSLNLKWRHEEEKGKLMFLGFYLGLLTIALQLQF
jgi:hypothetical protein